MSAPARDAIQPAPAEFHEFDFDAPPAPPDWIVPDFLERGTVTLLTGDTGALKSYFGYGVTAAALLGEPFLGREVAAERVLIVDEENHVSIPTARLRALGVTNDHADRLRYVSRQGAALGRDDWDAWLAAVAADFRPDIVIVDGLMSATDVRDINDNSEAVRVMGSLRRFAAEHDVGAFVYHHERKRQLGHGRGDASHAGMGARQLVNQADAGFGMALVERDPDDLGDGRERLTTTVKVEVTKPPRNAIPPAPFLLTVESEFEDGALLLSTLSAEPVDSEPEPSKEDLFAQSIAAVLREEGGPLKSGEIAKRLGVTVATSSFKRGRQRALEEGSIAQTNYGVYVATNHDNDQPAV